MVPKQVLRFLALAAAACLCAPVSVEATRIQLEPVLYQVTIDPSGSAPHFFSLLTPFPPDFSPVPLFDFISPGSSLRVSVDPSSSYSVTATQITGKNPPVAQDRADVTLMGGGSITANFHMEVLARALYSVIVSKKPGRVVPSSVDGVPIIGTATGRVECSSSSGASVDSIAQVAVENLETKPNWVAACNEDGVILPDFDKAHVKKGKFPIDEPILISNTVSSSMTLFVGGVFPMDHASFSAFADPDLEIDPSFPYADDFQLEYSPGFDTPIDNGGTDVPEPPSVALFVSALVLLLIVSVRSGRLRLSFASRPC
jgi:hypothetical protein